MRGYTNKHLLETYTSDSYHYWLYTSGGTLHTVKRVCVTTGETVRRSFRGRVAAQKWIDETSKEFSA